jgi:hypothetical protein
MIRKVKDYKNRNRYDSNILSSSNSFERFKELLQRLKILRHYELSYKYLVLNPKQRVKDETIRKSLSVVTKRLFHEGMSMPTLAKLYSGNISDNSLRTYFNRRMDRKAQSIVFAPIEAKEFTDVIQKQLYIVRDELMDGYVLDETKKIDEPLLVQIMIKNDVRKKVRNRYKKLRLS